MGPHFLDLSPELKGIILENLDSDLDVLHLAGTCKHLKEIVAKLYLPRNRPGHRAITLLHYAVRHLYAVDGLAKRLLDLGMDPNVQDRHGRTPLHYTAKRRDPDMMNMLIARGADPNARDAYNGTPLHVAVHFGLIRTAFALIDAGSNIWAFDQEQRSPVHVILHRRGASALHQILTHARDIGVLPQPVPGDNRWILPYEHAVSTDNVLAVKVLHYFGYVPPVMFVSKAIKAGSSAVLKELFAKHHQPDPTVWSIVLFAPCDGKKKAECMKVCVDSLGVPFASLDPHRFRNLLHCIHMAAFGGEYELVEYLLSIGARHTNQGYVNSLVLAAHEGHTNIVELLISHGADVNAASPTSWRLGFCPSGVCMHTRPIEAAMLAERLDIVLVLLRAGAYLDVDGVKWCRPSKAVLKSIEHRSQSVKSLRNTVLAWVNATPWAFDIQYTNGDPRLLEREYPADTVDGVHFWHLWEE